MTTVTIYIMKTEQGNLYPSLADLSGDSSETLELQIPVVLENGKSCLGVGAPNEDAWQTVITMDALYDQCHGQDLIMEFAAAAFHAGVQYGLSRRASGPDCS